MPERTTRMVKRLPMEGKLSLKEADEEGKRIRNSEQKLIRNAEFGIIE